MTMATSSSENYLGGGSKMFSTIGNRLHETTGGLANSDAKLAALMNKHGARKFWAAVKAQGLEPEDVDRNAQKDQIVVHEKVPAGTVPQIKEHRSKMWEDLRQSRLRDIEVCLEGLNEDDIRRYWKCSYGINPVDPNKDLPPADELGGMEEFNRMQEEHHGRVKAEQKRKATALGLEFLMEKKKREAADAKVAAFEKRIAEYKKDQAEEWKNRSIAAAKKAEKRTADAARAAKARADWEDETEAALWQRFGGAKDRREFRYSPAGLQAKAEAARLKREAAFEQAVLLEEEMLDTLETRRINCEERLEVRRLDVQAQRDQQRADSQAAFQKRQVMIHAKTTEWVEGMLADHAKSKQHLEDSREQYRQNLKEKSKSTGDVRNKTWKKVEENKKKNMSNQNESNSNLMARHAAADVRREELNSMAFKNENDIYTFREMKHHTFGELCRRRRTEIKNRTDNHSQHLIYNLAEKQSKMGAQAKSMYVLRKARMEIGKQALTLQDRASEGFLKIQSEPNEAKVIATMNAMGFEMPVLPEKDDDVQEEEGAKAAF